MNRKSGVVVRSNVSCNDGIYTPHIGLGSWRKLMQLKLPTPMQIPISYSLYMHVGSTGCTFATEVA